MVYILPILLVGITATTLLWFGIELVQVINVIEALSSIVLVLVTISYVVGTYRILDSNKRILEHSRRDREVESVKKIITEGIEPLQGEIGKHRDPVSDLSFELKHSYRDYNKLERIIVKILNRNKEITWEAQPNLPEIPEWSAEISDEMIEDMEELWRRNRRDLSYYTKWDFDRLLSSYMNAWENYRSQRESLIRNLTFDIESFIENKLESEDMTEERRRKLESLNREFIMDVVETKVSGDRLQAETSEKLTENLQNEIEEITLKAHRGIVAANAETITEGYYDLQRTINNFRYYCMEKYGFFEIDLKGN